jgi:hypothetical protein
MHARLSNRDEVWFNHVALLCNVTSDVSDGVRQAASRIRWHFVKKNEKNKKCGQGAGINYSERSLEYGTRITKLLGFLSWAFKVC